MCLPPRASSQVFEGSEEVEVDSTSAGVGIGFTPNLNGRVKLEKRKRKGVREKRRWCSSQHILEGTETHPSSAPPPCPPPPLASFRTGPDMSHSSCSCVLRSSVSTATQHPPARTSAASQTTNSASASTRKAPPSGCRIPQTLHDQMENLFLMATAQRCSS